MPQEAPTSFTVSDACGLSRSESRSHVDYLIPTNNIIVLDSYFDLRKKSNLTDRL